MGRRLDSVADAPFPPGSVGAGKVWSTKERLKAAQLPTTGRIRYVPPKGYEASNPIPRGPSNGYIDRFDNEWTRGPSRTTGQPFEWDVQLSRTGREKIGWLTRDGSHANVLLDGKITHK
jgi:filamentous hemagglutinin